MTSLGPTFPRVEAQDATLINKKLTGPRKSLDPADHAPQTIALHNLAQNLVVPIAQTSPRKNEKDIKLFFIAKGQIRKSTVSQKCCLYLNPLNRLLLTKGLMLWVSPRFFLNNSSQYLPHHLLLLNRYFDTYKTGSRMDITEAWNGWRKILNVELIYKKSCQNADP